MSLVGGVKPSQTARQPSTARTLTTRRTLPLGVPAPPTAQNNFQGKMMLLDKDKITAATAMSDGWPDWDAVTAEIGRQIAEKIREWPDDATVPVGVIASLVEEWTAS